MGSAGEDPALTRQPSDNPTGKVNHMNESPTLTTLAMVEFGSRVAVMGDERLIERVIADGEPVNVVDAAGNRVPVTPGARWEKRTGARRFFLRGAKGHGPRGGRKRYPQPIAAFYPTDDVATLRPMSFEDGAMLLTAEADSLAGDDPRSNRGTSGTARRTGDVTTRAGDTDAVAAILAQLTPEQLAAILAQATGSAAQPTPDAATETTPETTGKVKRGTVRSTSGAKRRTSGTVKRTAVSAEQLLGI